MADFDMPPRGAGFPARGRWLIDHLSADLDLTENQAAGIVGNIGFESGGLIELQEQAPIAGRGGRGWAQWTGPRRNAFEAWSAAASLDPDSDAANYGYLLVELRVDYRHTVDALRATTTVDKAVWSVGQTYERPYGTTDSYLPGFNDRVTYAMRALAAPSAAVTVAVAAATPAPPAPDIGGLAVALGTAARNMQTALAALGYDPGPIDGIWGKDSQAALERYRAGA